MQTQNQLPRELCAVLHIFNYDDELKFKALRHVDVEKQSIHWKKIFANDFGGGHSAAIVFAHALWRDRVETKTDPFDRAFAMDTDLQVVCLQALAIRWGLQMGEKINGN